MHWEPDFEAGFAGLGFEFDFTAMTVGHDAVADNQSKARCRSRRIWW